MRKLQFGEVFVLAFMRLAAKLHCQPDLAPEKRTEIWAFINVKF